MTPLRANLVALLGALAWGLGNVSQKTILTDLDGFAASGVTSILGAIVFLPLALREANYGGKYDRGSLPLLITISLFFALAATTMQFGYGSTTVSNGGFLVNSATVITPVIGWMFFGKRPPNCVWPAGLLALLGVFLMSGAAWSRLTWGDELSLLAALFYAVWTVLVGEYVTRYRRPILLTVFQLVVCGVACICLGAITYGFPTRAAIAAALPEIIFIGVISKGLAYMLVATAQQYIAPSAAAVLLSAEAIFGASAAVALLGESFGPSRSVGALCIMLGIVIAARQPNQAAIAKLQE